MNRLPTYLRVVVTTQCNLSCSYCHLEGDPQIQGTARALPVADLKACLDVASALGMRKYKFLGGEPLVRKDLPEVIRHLRQRQPDADLSIITAGVVPVERLQDAYAAGLSRANISIHGFSPQALGRRTSLKRAHELRQQFIETALSYGRPLKLNYVYGSVFDHDDLGALLEWAASRRVVVNVLDDLQKNGSWQMVASAVERLRGAPQEIVSAPDPDSLETRHWIYADGLRIEIKTERLGDHAPYRTCTACPRRTRCKEGIFALRLTHNGMLQPCMDRPDLGFRLAETIRAVGFDEALGRAQRWMEAL